MVGSECGVPEDVRLGVDKGDCAANVEVEVDVAVPRMVSVCTREPRTVKSGSDRKIEIKRGSAGIVKELQPWSGAVPGLVNRFPRFSAFQDFILTRPHF
jgi:hypothetical protein